SRAGPVEVETSKGGRPQSLDNAVTTTPLPVKGAHMRKNFLLLLSLNEQDREIASALLQRLQREVDKSASPLWFDSRGAGIFISTELSSHEIWDQAWPDSLPSRHQSRLKDMLILQVGPDWMGRADGTASAWLNARF